MGNKLQDGYLAGIICRHYYNKKHDAELPDKYGRRQLLFRQSFITWENTSLSKLIWTAIIHLWLLHLRSAWNVPRTGIHVLFISVYGICESLQNGKIKFPATNITMLGRIPLSDRVIMLATSIIETTTKRA